jgi:hypothetical protein
MSAILTLLSGSGRLAEARQGGRYLALLTNPREAPSECRLDSAAHGLQAGPARLTPMTGGVARGDGGEAGGAGPAGGGKKTRGDAARAVGGAGRGDAAVTATGRLPIAGGAAAGYCHSRWRA